MKIDIEDIYANANERWRWDSQDFRDLEFYYDGKRVIVPEEKIKEFIFMGLNNTDFILMDIVDLGED